MIEVKPSLEVEHQRFKEHSLANLLRYRLPVESGISSLYWYKNERGGSEAMAVNPRLLYASLLVASGRLNEGY